MGIIKYELNHGKQGLATTILSFTAISQGSEQEENQVKSKSKPNPVKWHQSKEG